MNNLQPTPQEMLLRDQINAIVPDGYVALESIDALKEHHSAIEIVSTIAEFSCLSQNEASISAGRNAFKRLPRLWVLNNFSSIIEKVVNIDDPWEYRRLLELLRDGYDELFKLYIGIGLKSGNTEIHEAATDLGT